MSRAVSVRLATAADLDSVVEIYDSARAFMRASGNPTQWSGGYPSRELLEEDVKQHRLYCVVDEAGRTVGVFALFRGADPYYEKIYEGRWRSDTPYASIHRIARSAEGRGVLEAALQFARGEFPHLRIDTHAANLPMQKHVQEQGFCYCGIIYVGENEPRKAYDWLAEEDRE